MISTFEEELARHGQLVYTVVGVSMLPLLRQRRDLVILQPPPPGGCQKRDVALYRRDSGQYVLHRILQVRPGAYVLCGDNCYRREYGITDRHILGVMTAFVRDGRTISVEDPRYKRYVRLWCDFYPVRAAVLWAKALPGRIRRRLNNRMRKKH